jgi:N-Acetylglucosaminyltransferase-IV (GnT-IV) conserved region
MSISANNQDQSTANKILSIGLCTVSTREESYLEECVDSIIRDASGSGYLSDMVINILDCDIGIWEAKPIVELKIKYGRLFTDGVLKFSRVDPARYPDFDRDPIDPTETKERFAWLSKQCFDAGLLFEECIGQASYHLHLEDDVLIKPGFFEKLLSTIYFYQKNKWSTLRFGKRGFIGHLFHGEELEKIAMLLQVYHDEIPVDWLIDYYCKIKGMSGYQVGIHRDGLISHIGVKSSLPGQERPKEIFG